MCVVRALCSTPVAWRNYRFDEIMGVSLRSSSVVSSGHVVVAFTIKTVPVSAKHLPMSVLVQLTLTPSVVISQLPQKGVDEIHKGPPNKTRFVTHRNEKTNRDMIDPGQKKKP